MKNRFCHGRISCLFPFLLIILLLCNSYACSNYTCDDLFHAELPVSESAARFPESLQYLGEGAFTGTLIGVVYLNNGISYIGDFAFEKAEFLTDIFIPATVWHIGKDAFPVETVIHGDDDGYAKAWARENGYAFIAEPTLSMKNNERIRIEKLVALSSLVILTEGKKKRSVFRRAQEFVRSMRPKDRPELYPINYRFP